MHCSHQRKPFFFRENESKIKLSIYGCKGSIMLLGDVVAMGQNPVQKPTPVD